MCSRTKREERKKKSWPRNPGGKLEQVTLLKKPFKMCTEIKGKWPYFDMPLSKFICGTLPPLCWLSFALQEVNLPFVVNQSTMLHNQHSLHSSYCVLAALVKDFPGKVRRFNHLSPRKNAIVAITVLPEHEQMRGHNHCTTSEEPNILIIMITTH